MATTEHLELPDGEWAEIRDPKKVPERLRRPVREAAIELQRSLPEDQRRSTVKVAEAAETAEPDSAFGAPPIEGLVEEAAKADDLPFLPTTEQQKLVDVYNEALLMSVVTAWSFGDVTKEVLQDLPGDAFDILLETVRNHSAKVDAEGSADSLAADPSRALSALAATLRDGTGDRSDLPAWLLAAEREFQIAQALPNRNIQEIDDMPADELDAILSVAEVYRGVYGKDPYRHTHE